MKKPLETQDLAPQSVSTAILDFLEGKDWTWGGIVEDYIRAKFGHKASTASRECRRLVTEGKIEVVREQVNGKGAHCVKYRKI